MPIEYEIIENKKLVLAKGTGVITGSEVISHLDTIADDHRYVAPMKKLIDYRLVDALNITQQEAWTIAQKKSELSTKFSGEQCAFVSPDDSTYGTSRVHQMLVNGTDLNTQVFRSIDEALKWLDISLDR